MGTQSLPRQTLKILRSTWEWVKDLGEVLKPCRFSVFAMVILFIVFLFIPQGQDLLRRMAEWNDRSWLDLVKVLGLSLLALLCLATSSWYFSRVMLYFHFSHHRRAQNPRLENLRLWLPRLLGTTPFAILFLAFSLAALSYKNSLNHWPRYRLWGMALICLLAGVRFFVSIKLRRHRRPAQKRPLPSPTRPSFFRLRDIPRGTSRTLIIATVASVALFIAFTIAPIKLGACFGATGIVLIATATWIPIGSALVYFGHRARLPILTLLALLGIGSSFFNDNHVVRTFPDPQPPEVLADDLDHHLSAWLEDLQHDEPEASTYPVFIVSTEGGGGRAAYWTANVLTQLQEENPSFARHIYAISGVSGGSLGAATFAALLRTAGAKDTLYCKRPVEGLVLSSLRGCAQTVLSHDFLSPTLARMLHSDLAQRLFPYPVLNSDRSLALEHSWEAAWRDTVKGSDQFGKPFADLWNGPSYVPNLVFNGTWVETGKRIITTNLRFHPSPFNDSQDLFSWTERDVPLSTAVHNSARFAYISPAGLIKNPKGRAEGHIVDGGYFENSGGTSAYELFSRVVVLKERLEEAKAPFRIIPVLITISNTPKDEAPMGGDVSVGLLDTRAPLLTMYRTRTARATYAMETLEKYAVSENQETCRRQGESVWSNCREILSIPFGTCKEDLTGQRFTAPLGWQLSGVAILQMNGQLENGCRYYKNRGSRELIAGLLKPAARGLIHKEAIGFAMREL